MDFNVPNLPGASAIYNKIAAKVADIEKDIKAALDITASEIKAIMDANMVDLVERTKGLIPELPTTTPVNFQAEVEGLLSMAPTSAIYAEKLASLTTSFGPGLKDAGYALDDLVVAGAAALKGDAASLAGAIPNFEIPPGSLDAIEVAHASLMPDLLTLKEAAHKFSEDVSEDDIKGLFGDKFSTEELNKTKTAMEAHAKQIEKVWGAKMKRLGVEIEARAEEVRKDSQNIGTSAEVISL